MPELHEGLQTQLDHLEKLMARKDSLSTGFQALGVYDRRPYIDAYEAVIEILDESIRNKTLEILTSPGKRQS
jgi:hypothetical protein